MTDWTLAGCTGDPEAMYEDGAAAIAYNRRVCAACPIRAACLQRALDLREPWGMWGGLTPRERDDLLNPAPRRMAERNLKPCGTAAAARRHQRRGEPVCPPCRQAAACDKQERWPHQAAGHAASRSRRLEREKSAA